MALAPGTRLGRYEVLSPLGAGGMGEVFRARDTKLGRDVALKVLPDRFSGDRRMLVRFESEAKAVAALSHPHILALFDVGEEDGVPYAVAELLEGETLRALLMRGPLPVKRALEIAREVAEGLAAVHERGIVHRDVKPENVFLTKDGHAKVLDFGLARHESAFRAEDDSRSPTLSALTEAGAVVGTVAYMSPEQARGLPVDHRSDQFSLGVVIYEMLAGRKPFRGDTRADVLTAIIRDEPEPLGRVPGGWSPQVLSILDRCLAKGPVDRYDSTWDLAREVSACWLRLSSTADGHVDTARTPGRSARRLIAVGVGAGLAGVVLLLALANGLRRSDDGPASTSAARPLPGGTAGTRPATVATLDPRRVAVAPFENRTGEAPLDPIGRMAAEWVTQGLSGLRIDVVPSADVFEVPSREKSQGKPEGREPIRAMAERTGAGIVVSGAYYLAGTSVRFQAQISEIATGKLLRALEPAVSPGSDPMPAIDSVRRQARDVLAIRMGAAVDDILANELKPPKYEAYAEYLLGEERFGIEPDVAEAHYRRALEIDPDFVLPRFILVIGLRNQLRYADADRELVPVEAVRDRLPPVYRAFLDGCRAMLEGRHEATLAAAREVLRLSPGDIVQRFDRAYWAFVANRPREAVEVWTGPGRWDVFTSPGRPFGSTYFQFLGAALHALGRYEEELATYGRGRTIYSGMWPGLDIGPLVALGRFADVERLVRDTPGRAGVGLALAAGSELRGHGHAEDARQMYETGLQRLQELPQQARDARWRTSFAQALLGAERWKEAERALADLERERPGEDPRWRGLRALAALRSGDDATARQIDAELARLERPFLLGEASFHRAVLAAHSGEKDRAVTLLRRALAEGYFDGYNGVCYWAHRSGGLAPLFGYSPYEELTRPKG